MAFFNDPERSRRPPAGCRPERDRDSRPVHRARRRLEQTRLRAGCRHWSGSRLCDGRPIGFEGRLDYGAVGNVVILASRLSDVAPPGEILLSQRLNAAVEQAFATEPLPEQSLKGFSRPIAAFRVVGTAASAV